MLGLPARPPPPGGHRLPAAVLREPARRRQRPRELARPVQGPAGDGGRQPEDGRLRRPRGRGADPRPQQGRRAAGRPRATSPRPPMSYRYGDVVSPYLVVNEPLSVEDEHFVDCILTGMRPLTDGDNGLAVVEVLEAAQLSVRAATGRGPLARCAGASTVPSSRSRARRTGRPPGRRCEPAGPHAGPRSGALPRPVRDDRGRPGGGDRRVERAARRPAPSSAGRRWPASSRTGPPSAGPATPSVSPTAPTPCTSRCARSGSAPATRWSCPANTFVATAEAVVLAGARPRFADVDPDTLLITAGDPRRRR